MSDLGPEDVEGDPWLTVAEIGEELRVNPATVRLWISKGALPATRAGQRKLLIRRSDLEYMLDVIRREPPARGYQPRPRNPQGGMGPPQPLDQLSTADIHGRRAAPHEMQEIIEELDLPTMSGSARWLRASTPRRTRAFHTACARSPMPASSRRERLRGRGGSRDSRGLRSPTVIE